MEPGKEMWSQADRYSQREREDTDAEESETKKMTKVDRKREQLGEKKCQVKRQRDQITTKDRWRERRKEKGIWRKGRQGGHWKTRGGELSEHPILEEGGLGVGDDGEEIVRRCGRW